MKIYQFRVSIIGLPRSYRILDISENGSFDDFHDGIFAAFDRYDSHLYSFFITRRDTQDIRKIYGAPEITHPQNLHDNFGLQNPRRRSTAKAKIADIGLHEHDIIHYLFDFGDEWWHRIRLQSIREADPTKKYCKLIKSVGLSPPQYPKYEDDDEPDERNR